MGDAGKPIMLMGLDDSNHSYHALEWTIDHFFTPHGTNYPFKLIIIHARPTAASAVGLAGPGSADFLLMVDTDLKRQAQKVTDKVRQICSSKSLDDVQVDVTEGDPRTVMVEAVDKYHAAMLVLGSHGYGAIKRAVLGSVSDFCAHHAHCSVMIVKKPKAKPKN
ncbi:Usp domain-containing protein [Cephalotus follicularis]|uniref:Usp domain-containing protein n=1 Tax=Cephalotus follicularis TaxID=3775 RepID=A0A1Q3C3T6_CEPFO|nr:Usp domain-containing protein [Cephalotus follicularis]